MLKAAAQNGLDRRAGGGAREPDRDPPRRGRSRADLLREGGRGLALSGADAPTQAAAAEGPLAQRRRGGPARRRRQAPHEPAPVELRARSRAVRGDRRRRGLGVDEVLSRTQRLLDQRIIREITPIFDTRALGYASMLVAAKVDDEQPAARRPDHQRPPRRLPQLPAHARVQPLVHDRDAARLRAWARRARSTFCKRRRARSRSASSRP